MTKSDLNSLDFVVNRFSFMKLFKTDLIDLKCIHIASKMA